MSGLVAGIVAVCLALVGGPVLAYEPPTTSPFTDVPVTHPYYKEIAWMSESGISTGWPDGTYRPSQQVDRDAMAAFFYRFKGSPAYTLPATSPFTDITPSIQFYKEMAWMKETGISTGWPDGTYRPWDTTLRDAMSAFIYRVAGSPAYTLPATSPFTDITPATSFYKEMCWLAEKGIANNIEDGTFDPWAPVTREMMAVFMFRLANPTGVAVLSAALPAGVVAVAYTASLQAGGGTPPYTWSAGELPGGLSISPQGEISGTPTSAGTAQVTVTVTDGSGGTATRSLSLVIKAAPDPLGITTASLPVGAVGSAYTASVAAEGGVGPYTWSATGLPAGLTMSTNGQISGTPTTAATSTVAVTVTDGTNTTVTKDLSLTVNIALSVTTTSLPIGVQGTPYGATVTAQGGVGPYTWSATGLPAGLTMSTNGQISGTPTTAATKDVVVQVKDSGNATASATLRLEISAANNCDVLRCIAITFDDGPLAYSDQLLNAFTSAKAKATFFEVGERVKANPGAVARKHNAGMEIGMHGWQHLYYTDYGPNYVRYDFNAAAQAIENATGERPNLYRPNYGYYNPTIRDIAGDLGMATILWTDNTFDYEYTNAQWLRDDTVDMASRNSVILMHDGYAATGTAIPGIIADLQAQGYTLVTVSMLLGGDPVPGRVYFDPDPVYH